MLCCPSLLIDIPAVHGSAALIAGIVLKVHVQLQKCPACALASWPHCQLVVLMCFVWGLQLPRQCIWELEMKEPSGGSWHTIHPVHASLSAAADRLTPGTKYIFRARAGEVLLNWIHSQRSCVGCSASFHFHP